MRVSREFERGGGEAIEAVRERVREKRKNEEKPRERVAVEVSGGAGDTGGACFR